MVIRLICDLCEKELSIVDDVVLALQHWAIVRNLTNKYDERHFCPDCFKKEKGIITQKVAL